MRNQIALLVVGVAFFIVSCQTGHGPAATPSPNSQTTTLAPTQTDVASGSTTTPKCFTTMEGNPIEFMPDSIRILIRENEGVRIFNLETMKEEKDFQAPQGFGPVALSPDGDLLAWALQDYSIQLIRMTDGNLLNTLQGHTLPVTKLRFSTAGDRLFSASVDTWIRIWDRNGKLLDAFQPLGADNLPNEIEGIGISPDGTMLGSVPFDGPARVWNLADKKRLSI